MVSDFRELLFLSDLSGGDSFESVDQLWQAYFGKIIDQQVDMVALSIELRDLYFKSSTNLFHQVTI